MTAYRGGGFVALAVALVFVAWFALDLSQLIGERMPGVGAAPGIGSDDPDAIPAAVSVTPGASAFGPVSTPATWMISGAWLAAVAGVVLGRRWWPRTPDPTATWHGRRARVPAVGSLGVALLLVVAGGGVLGSGWIEYAGTAALVPLGLVGVIVGRPRLPELVRVSAHGIHVTSGIVGRSMRWDQIDSCDALPSSAWILRGDGLRIRIPAGLTGADVLSTRLLATSRERLGDVRGRLEQGGELDFGRVRVTRSELRVDSLPVPWSSISTLTVSDGRVTVDGHDGTVLAEFRLADLRDGPAFLTLADELLTGRDN